jgi:hypothetical protein
MSKQSGRQSLLQDFIGQRRPKSSDIRFRQRTFELPNLKENIMKKNPAPQSGLLTASATGSFI